MNSSQQHILKQVTTPLKKYASFKGRATRTELWGFTFIVFSIWIFLAVSSLLAGFLELETLGYVLAIAFYVFGLVTFLPFLAAAVRRLHDSNRSGWFVLLGLIPCIGELIFIVFMCLPTELGKNRYDMDWAAPDKGGGVPVVEVHKGKVECPWCGEINPAGGERCLRCRKHYQEASGAAPI